MLFESKYFSVVYGFEQQSDIRENGLSYICYLFDRNRAPYHIENELACYVIRAARMSRSRAMVKSVTNGGKSCAVDRCVLSCLHSLFFVRGWCIGVFAPDRAFELASTFAYCSEYFLPELTHCFFYDSPLTAIRFEQYRCPCIDRWTFFSAHLRRSFQLVQFLRSRKYCVIEPVRCVRLGSGRCVFRLAG